MICAKCGAAIPEGDQVCPACGQGVTDVPEAASADVLGEVAPVPEETVDTQDIPDNQQPLNGEIGQALLGDGEETSAPAPGKKTKRRVLIAVTAVVLVAALAVAAWLIFLRKPPTAMDRVVEMVDCLSDNATDVAMETIGVPGDTVMLTVNGREVTAEEYLYWLGYNASYYEMISSYSGGTMDLTQEAQDGVTWDQQLKQDARDSAVFLALVPSLAEERGVELTDEDLQQVVDNRTSSIESAGGEEMYVYQLQAMGINDETFLRMGATAALYDKVQAAWLDKTKAELTAEEMATYIEENDLLRAKHILLLTKDTTTGEAYDDAKIAQQKAKADELLTQLRADPSKFDELMQANSEDTGLSAYPDGYLFSAGEMVSEFEAGTRALAVGDISEVIESDYGYHIILRLDADCDETRQQLAGNRVNEEIQARIDAAEVVESETYKNLTTAGYYEKLTAFQDGLTRPEVVDQSQAELQTGDQTEPTAEPETEPEPTQEPGS